MNTVLVEQIDCTLLLELLVWGFKGVFYPSVCGKVVEKQTQKSGTSDSSGQDWEKIMIREVFWGYSP